MLTASCGSVKVDVHEDYVDINKRVCFGKDTYAWLNDEKYLGGGNKKLASYYVIKELQGKDQDIIINATDIFLIIGVLDFEAEGNFGLYDHEARYVVFERDGKEFLANRSYYYEQDKRCSAAITSSNTANVNISSRKPHGRQVLLYQRSANYRS